MDEIHRDIDAQKKACPICGVPLARWVALWRLDLCGGVVYLLSHNLQHLEGRVQGRGPAYWQAPLQVAHGKLDSGFRQGQRPTCSSVSVKAGARGTGETRQRTRQRNTTIHDSYASHEESSYNRRDVDTNAEILYQSLQEEMHAHLGNIDLPAKSLGGDARPGIRCTRLLALRQFI